MISSDRDAMTGRFDNNWTPLPNGKRLCCFMKMQVNGKLQQLHIYRELSLSAISFFLMYCSNCVQKLTMHYYVYDRSINGKSDVLVNMAIHHHGMKYQGNNPIQSQPILFIKLKLCLSYRKKI